MSRVKGVVGYKGGRTRRKPEVVVTRDKEGRLRGLPRWLARKEEKERLEQQRKQDRRQRGKAKRQMKRQKRG